MAIVCAHHFSEWSLAAIDVASRQARLTGQALWLVDVIPPVGIGQSDPGLLTVSPALERAATELSHSGLVVGTKALWGPFTRAIRQFCARRADLLVIGDSKRNFGPLLAGPLDRFSERVGVPVLVVRDSEPFAKWNARAPLKLLLAIDRTWRAGAAREWISHLAAHGPIELVASYLSGPRDEEEREIAQTAQSRGATPIRTASMEIESALARLPSNVRLRFRRDASRPRAGTELLRLANAEHADVVVVGTHPHHGPVGQQWSISHELLALAPMSVACIPEPSAAAASQPRRDRQLVQTG